MFCIKCGAQLNEGVEFCHQCGEKIVSMETTPQPIGSLQNVDNRRQDEISAIDEIDEIELEQELASYAREDMRKTMREGIEALVQLVALVVLIIGGAFLILSKADFIIDIFRPGANVRYAYLTQYSEDVTVEEAFNGFFSDGKWSTYKKDGYSYVVFTGVCEYRGEEADVRITFKITGKQFRVERLDINGEEQNDLMREMTLAKIYEITNNQATGSGSQSAMDTEYSDQIVLNGVPVVNLLGCATEELYTTFGAPTSGTPVNGEWYMGVEFYGYDGVAFFIDPVTKLVSSIMADPGAVELNGTTLDKTSSELIELLGTPVSEGSVPGFLEEGIPDSYEMVFFVGGVRLRIMIDDMNGVVYLDEITSGG